MLLKKLIKNSPQNLKYFNIKGLALNSKNVKRDYIFFALKGYSFNGENYIDHAIKNGARVIFCSKTCQFKSKKAYIIKINNVKKYLNEITHKFYKKKPKNIFAVTGTNGKTSVANFFYQILHANNIPVASIGTLGIRYGKKFIKTNLTSPDIITLHKNLEILKKKKIDNVIIEASSHGLIQGRLDGLKLKAGIFTNFSQDHLDYHKTMKSYLNAKLILFSKLLPKKSYIITNQSIKEFFIIKKISQKKNLRLLTIDQEFNQLKKISTSLIGSFQIKNLSMAVLTAKLCKLSNSKIYKALKKIRNVDGRLEFIKRYPNNIRVFIDYAHTPDALYEVLKSIKDTFNKNISLVFGCGGDRDFKKRPIMAKIAKKFCEKIYVTDDNPRRENPKKIRKEIVKHLRGCCYFNIGNRSEAIKKAVTNASLNETILIAGKGHEDYQDYGKKVISISDKTIVKKLRIKKKIKSLKEQSYLFNKRILNKILLRENNYKFDKLSIDSREIKKNNLFLAIKGKNKDGHNFISKAIKNGASHVISSKNYKKYKKVIKVKNTISFLNKFAQMKRLYTEAKILGITGSVGKTSLKNILYNLLKKYGKSYASPRSFNNHFGVPLSLSNLNYNDEFGIFEVGMSRTGEINKLSKMIKPNVAIITNIGEAHIENFKNIKGIANAKSEIIANVQREGTVILNRDDKFFKFLQNKANLKNIKVITFGKSKKSNIRLIKIKQNKLINQLTISVRDKVVELKIKDINIYNVLASLAVLEALGLKLKKFSRVFETFRPSEGRGKIHKIKRYKKIFRLIDESYNASPSSVNNAIINFSKIKKDGFKKYLFLGDMLELGKKSEIYHKKLSRVINSSDIDKVFVKGKNSLFTYKNLKKDKRGNIFQCNQDVDLILKNIIANDDYLMIKGSNATGLNFISNSMIKGLNVI